MEGLSSQEMGTQPTARKKEAKRPKVGAKTKFHTIAMAT